MTRTDKGKDRMSHESGEGFTFNKGGSLADGEMAGYIEKGKKLTNDYLSNAFEHMKVHQSDNLGQQEDKLTINHDVFAARVARL